MASAHQNSSKNWFLSNIVQILCGTLRGIGQVAFVNSAVTGGLIYTGCSLERPLAAFLGLLACLLGTSLGFVIPSEREAAINGLYGYNGYLFGMGVGYFNAGLTKNAYDWITLVQLLPVVLLGGIICFLVHVALSKSMAVPPFTFAYNITLSCWLSYAATLAPDSCFSPTFMSPHQSPEAVQYISYNNIDFPWFMTTALAGVGQVFFCPELRGSVLIICGLAVGSPIAATLGFFGGIIGSGVAILTHGSVSLAEAGIYGLSAVLASIGLGAFYFCLSWKSVILAFLGSLLSIMMTPLMAGLLVRPGGPCMTFPFCLAASLLYLSAKHLGKPLLVPKPFLESPEMHLVRKSEFEGIREMNKIDSIPPETLKPDSLA